MDVDPHGGPEGFFCSEGKVSGGGYGVKNQDRDWGLCSLSFSFVLIFALIRL